MRRREQRRSHHVQMVAAVQNGPGRRVERNRARSAVLDVVYEGAGSIRPVSHEGAARGRLGIDPDAFHIDPVTTQAIEIDPPEFVVPHATDDGGWLTKLRGLIDEDRRRAGRERANQLDRLEESVALARSP